MMENPFSLLERRLNRLESLLIEIKDSFYTLPLAPNHEDKILTLEEAANYLRLSPSLLYRNPKKWGGKKIATQWRFRQSLLDQMMAGGTNE